MDKKPAGKSPSFSGIPPLRQPIFPKKPAIFPIREGASPFIYYNILIYSE